MLRHEYSLATLIILNLLAPSAVSAGDSPAASATDSKTAAADTKTAAPNSTLSGSVNAVDLEAAENLRQMGDCLKKMERAALELMGEATRQAYISVGDPDVIGTMIIPAMPSPSGIMGVGPYLKIRKKMMDYYLDQIGTLIPIYAEYTDALVMPASTKAQAIPLLDQMRAPFARAKTNYETLVTMSKTAPDISNHKVADLSVLVHDDYDNINKLRLSVFQLLKASEKVEKK